MEGNQSNEPTGLTDKDRQMMGVAVTPESVEDNLETRIQQVAHQYHMEQPTTGWIFSRELPKENQVFLAMLDEYVSHIGYELPQRDGLVALDFGAGSMPYMDAYKAFVERFRKNEDEDSREARIWAWEGDRDSLSGGPVGWIKTELEDNRLLDYRFADGIDLLTMFGCGPSSQVSDPRAVEESYGRSIELLAPYIHPDGLLIMTTSFGGPTKSSLIERLQKNGLDVVFEGPNKYKEILGLRLGFSHDEIILARPNPGRRQ